MPPPTRRASSPCSPPSPYARLFGFLCSSCCTRCRSGTHPLASFSPSCAAMPPSNSAAPAGLTAAAKLRTAHRRPGMHYLASSSPNCSARQLGLHSKASLLASPPLHTAEASHCRQRGAHTLASCPPIWQLVSPATQPPLPGCLPLLHGNTSLHSIRAAAHRARRLAGYRRHGAPRRAADSTCVRAQS